MDISLLPDQGIIDLSNLDDEYVLRKIKLLLYAKTIEDLKFIVDDIYNDGFEDGRSNK